MSVIQIYYLIPSQLNKTLNFMNVDLSQILRSGDKTIEQVRNEIKTEPEFCRDESGIDFKYFFSSIISDITLYANLNGKVVGLLTFMFTEKDGNKYILLNGICSPAKYSGLGVGHELINTLIRIGKAFNINYIDLDCKGDSLMNYYKRFGFKVSNSYNIEDSDDEDDEGDVQYTMSLDLSTISGGKNNKKLKRKYRKTLKIKTRKTRRIKRKNTRRKLRKYH
jgi:hypothetical protein